MANAKTSQGADKMKLLAVAKIALGTLVVAAVSVFALALLLTFLWAVTDWHDDRKFDSALGNIRLGMSESEVVQVMGRRPFATFSQEADLEAYQRQMKKCYAALPRPIRVSNRALAFGAPLRVAYVYFDADDHVEAVVVAREVDDKFRLVPLQPESE
jgi:nitrogen fixation-related uncharacterized protein